MLRSLLEQVAFDTELSEVGSYAGLYFPNLPEGTDVRLYTGSGCFADEVALLTLPETADGDNAVQIVSDHIAELRDQFLNYFPEEVDKIDHAVIRQYGRLIFLCITNDDTNATLILDHAGDSPDQISGRETAPDPKTTENQPDLPSAPAPAEEYPVLQRCDGRLCVRGCEGILR